MSFVSRNHPQQVARRGALEDVDDRRTPPELLSECIALAGVTGFDLDVAASVENTKADQWFDVDSDGLTQPWSGRVWCNPPYSDCGSWVAKASAECGRTDVIAMLLPANRTEQKWWHKYVEPGRRAGSLDVYFLERRRRFDRPGWEAPKKGDRPPFGLCLVVWR